MLFGGNSGSCGGCGCKSCQKCTRGCTNPHTGTAFETVYTLYFEGAEAGNPSDDYLEATGDVDTSDPYDGMDGTGPWSQFVSGTFTLTKSTTRYPCYLTVSFWRSNFVLGANTIPPPATTLTTELITVTNQTSSEGAIYAGGFLLQPGESHQFDMTIPLVSGAGDQSTNDPGLYNGTIRVGAACVNDYVSFTVSGNIAWNVKKRQHVLYGRVRECYEDPDNPPCATFCDGDPPPDVLYLTISNYTGPEPASGSPNGTYVLERLPGVCDGFLGAVPWGCRPNSLTPDSILEGYDEARAFSNFISIGSPQIVNGECKILLLVAYDGSSVDKSYCGEGVLHSGTGLVYVHTRMSGALPEDIVPGSFDWEIST